MSGDEFETANAKESEDGNEIMKLSATYTPRLKHTSCQLSRLSKTLNSQVRPNGLRGCKCDKLPPYDKSGHTTEKLDNDGLVSCSQEKLRYAQRLKVNVTESPDFLKKENCFVDAKPAQKQSFVAPQGMDAGQYPEQLFNQYYPNRNRDHTFDLLPLPFLEKLKYQERCMLSMQCEDVEKKWKAFLYNLPNSEFESTIVNPDNKFWRWKKYLRYAPNENRNEFRYKMQVGPNYDNMGRLPITGEDLQTFREIKTKSKISSKFFLRKDDVTRKK